jgi:threonine/homoserine/homoserine lactone efflux protein
MTEVSGFFSIFWVIFSFSFLVALTGAMSPGPLLTYTIIRSVRAPRRGYLTGLWVIAGHAMLELFIICLLLLGFSVILNNLYVVRGIGLLGGMILVYFGVTIALDVMRGRVSTDFLNDSACGEKTSQGEKKCFTMENPVFGGILVSMSNPYWWVWWATIGIAFMVRFEISFENWPMLLAFFMGHEAGDLAWYFLVSILSFFGLRRLNKRAYCGVLFLCSAFMILFGFYLGASPLISGASIPG